MKSNQENGIMSKWRGGALALMLWIGAPALALAQNAIQSINSSQQGSSEVVRIELSEPLAAVPNGFTIVPAAHRDRPARRQQRARPLVGRAEPGQPAFGQRRAGR